MVFSQTFCNGCNQGVVFPLCTATSGLQDVVGVLSDCCVLCEGRLHEGAGSDVPVDHGHVRYIDSGCDFSFSALQWAAQSIHCKPASSSCHSSGWCSSSVSELAEKGDDQMRLVKKTKHLLYGNICSVSLSWRWNFTASRQNSLRGEIVAFWKAYLNIRCTEMTHQLCIKDFAISGNPEVGHSLLSTEVLLVNMLWALQKRS